jgi:hypothetical protein
MLISGGKVLAIDKVLHDQTLTGDGRFVKLGVNSGMFLTEEEADKRYMPSGDYPTTAWITARYFNKTYINDNYYKKDQLLRKDEISAQFQAKGDYATNTRVDSLETWVSTTYWTSAYIKDNYATIAYVDAAKNEAINTIRNEYDPRVRAVEDHAQDGSIHVTEDDKNLLAYLSGVDFSKIITVSGLDPNPSTVYGVRYDGTNWSFAEAGGGGGGGGYPIHPENGLTGDFIGDTLHIGIESYSRVADAIDLVYDKSSYWDAKQEALTNEQLSAISSVSSLMDTYDLIPGTCIDITTGAQGVTITYTGRQGNVELVKGEPASVNPDLIYLVTQDVDL